MAVPIAELFITVGSDVSGALNGIGRVESAMKSASASLAKAGTALSAGVTVPIVAAGAAIFQTGSKFETAMAGVRKTTGLTKEETAALGRELLDLSTTIAGGGLDATALAGIAKTAGQLGIAKDDIKDFTALAAQMSGATGIAADQIAEDLARIALLTNTPRTAWENMGSAIVALGNELEGSEKDIIATATRIAGPLTALGVTAQDVLGQAAASVAVGLEPEAGSTAIVRTYLDLVNAASAVNKVTDEQRTKMQNLNDRITDLNSQLENAVARQATFGRNTPASVVKQNADAIEKYKRELGQANAQLADLSANKGSKQLGAFAKVAGVTEAQFKAMVKENPTAAFDAVVDGLRNIAKTKGPDALATALDDLGIVEVRQRLLLLNLASASDKLTQAVGISNAAWQANTALQDENTAASETTERAFGLLQRKIEAELIKAWEKLQPVVLDFLNMVTDRLLPKLQELTDWFVTLPKDQQETILKFAALAAGIGPAVLALSVIAGVLAAFTGPVGLLLLVAAALFALKQAWDNDVGGMRTKIEELGAATRKFVDDWGNQTDGSKSKTEIWAEGALNAIRTFRDGLRRVILDALDLFARFTEFLGNKLPAEAGGKFLLEQAQAATKLRNELKLAFDAQKNMETTADNLAKASPEIQAAVAASAGGQAFPGIALPSANAGPVPPEVALSAAGQKFPELGPEFNAPIVQFTGPVNVQSEEDMERFSDMTAAKVIDAMVASEAASAAPVGLPLPGAPFGAMQPTPI